VDHLHFAIYCKTIHCLLVFFSYFTQVYLKKLIIVEKYNTMFENQELTIKFHSISLVGSGKKHNQDAYAEFRVPGGYGFAICDGINGNEGGGAIASKMAIDSIKRQFQNNQFKSPQKALANALTLANFQLYDHVQKNERFKGMGTSCVIILIIDNLVYYAYIGNTRLYFLRENTIYRLTRDHTEAQTDFVNKKISEDQLESHPGYYKPDRALGFNKDVNFSVCKQPIAIEEEDTLLLTSDGLFRELSESQIANLMDDPDASVEFVANNLAQKADEAGGSDNITISVVHVFNAAKVPFVPDVNVVQTKEPIYKKVPRIIWVVLGILALVAILFGINEMVFTNESVTQKQIEEQTQLEAQQQPKEDSSLQKEVIEQATEEVAEPQENVITPEYITLKIDKGDNFYRLGIRFNVTVQYLERINNVQSKRLRLGRQVRIPVKAIHKVVPRENLSLIAQKYQTPLRDLLKANKLESADKLSEGMELYIPLQYDDKISE
jgi:serine/threonine protein phosphatase PrpC